MIKRTYDYQNVYLMPQSSKVNSRDDVDLSVYLPNDIKLDIPIIASPMKGITSPEIISRISGDYGGIGILHRFFDDESDWIASIHEILSGMRDSDRVLDWNKFGVAIGLNDNKYKMALDYGASIICIDVANGYLDSVKRFCAEVASYLQNYLYDCVLMCGNVVTSDGVVSLANNGVNLVRIGIGTGNLCITRQVTGIGLGQVSALLECSIGKPKNTILVADGGIRSSGDAVKALAAGADLIMIGSLLGKTFESGHNGSIYGMASKRLQDEYYHMTKSIEGVEKTMSKTLSFSEFVYEFTYGMKSAFTYIDARNIEELRENAVFVEIN